MLIQSDGLDDADNSEFCSGFMFIKSNEKTISIFDPKRTEEFKDVLGWDDQVYINNVKDQLKCKKLPLDRFPNGRYYRTNFRGWWLYNIHKTHPYLIHFNWLVGGEVKKNHMRSHGKWFV